VSDTPAPEQPAAPVPAPAPARFPWPLAVALALALVGGSGGAPAAAKAGAKRGDEKAKPDDKKDNPPPEKKKVAAPELEGGIAWLNTAAPLTLKKDLKGKVVILDFWTLCCINCIHIMPDLAKLEKKYANELVVIGVHSAKFDSEKITSNIRKAILRYQIEHPVVNDAEHAIWDRYEVDAWPTLVVIDPEGNLVGYTTGEGNYDLLDTVVGKLVKEHKEKKTLNETPIRFDLARNRESGDTPLYFPGKVVADETGKRLFIADSTHHRLVVTDLEGNKLHVIGTGQPGRADGAFDKAQFDDPQGMAVRGDTLYVADRKNHVVRAVDLKAKTVSTVAGSGEQDHEPDNRRLLIPQPATDIGLNSPWDVLLEGDTLFVAMAGHHQIWALDLKAKKIGPFSGSGRETLVDGAHRSAAYAQPSGLASDGKFLYVADSETSSIRKVSLAADGRVETLVGRHLFEFGDVDGPGRGKEKEKPAPAFPGLRPEFPAGEARIQHALGVALAGDKLYVADTYNSKVKVYDPKTGELTTFVSGRPLGAFGPQVFNEPGGISAANGKLYVADTNAHRIRVIDIGTKAVSTLALKGVEPPVHVPSDLAAVAHGVILGIDALPTPIVPPKK
jgi:DNA-binding beta-propeller fold protein YncE